MAVVGAGGGGGCAEFDVESDVGDQRSGVLGAGGGRSRVHRWPVQLRRAGHRVRYRLESQSRVRGDAVRKGRGQRAGRGLRHDGGYYIGGRINSVGDVRRANLAHVEADGSVDPAWNPSADNGALALALSGSTVYAGGPFLTIGGAPREGFAAFPFSG